MYSTLFSLLLVLFVWIRNLMVYNIRISVLKECSQNATLATNRGEYNVEKYFIPLYNLPNHVVMCIQVWKWGRKGFNC